MNFFFSIRSLPGCESEIILWISPGHSVATRVKSLGQTPFRIVFEYNQTDCQNKGTDRQFKQPNLYIIYPIFFQHLPKNTTKIFQKLMQSMQVPHGLNWRQTFAAALFVIFLIVVRIYIAHLTFRYISIKWSVLIAPKILWQVIKLIYGSCRLVWMLEDGVDERRN